jgi:hypothetical protein
MRYTEDQARLDDLLDELEGIRLGEDSDPT